MVPFQKRFSLIPDLPSALNGNSDAAPTGRASRPPMTTKQAKKAYKAANKGPKISKAEQRRQDLMEQDRIRRELEKERNQARARTARDKRKEKEDKEKADKKKKGLPLVTVNPSQDTLARFVRNTALKKRAENQKATPLPAAKDDNSDATLSAEDEGERPAKRQRVDEPPKILDVKPASNRAMFKRPRPSQVDDSPKKSCLDYAESLRKGSSTPNPCSYDPDDPSTKDMVEKQIFNESFSADDGLFDDLILDFPEVQDPVKECSDIQQALPSERTSDIWTHPVDKIVVEDGRTGDLVLGSNDIATPQIMNTSQPLISTKSVAVEICYEIQSLTSARTGLEQTVTDVKPLLQKDAPENIVASGKSGGFIAQAVTCTEDKSLSVATDQRFPKTSSGDGNAAEIFCPESQSHVQVPNTQYTLLEETRLSQKAHPIKETHISVTKPESMREPWKPPVRPPLRNVPLNNTGVSKAKDLLPSKPLDGCKSTANTPQASFRKPQIPMPGPSAFRPPRTPSMGPPPLPPKFKSPSPSTLGHEGGGPRFLPRQNPLGHGFTKQSNLPTFPNEPIPPSSTQILLEDLGDLFPSPSQEVKEIFEDPISSGWSPSARPKARPIPKSLGPSPRGNQFRCSPSSSHPRVSRLPTRNVHTAAKQPSNLSSAAQNFKPAATPAILCRSYDGVDSDCIPFLSTQDMYLSSQDIMEIEELVVSPTNVPKPADAVFPSGSLPQVSESPVAPILEKPIQHRTIPNEAFTTPIRQERFSRVSQDEGYSATMVAADSSGQHVQARDVQARTVSQQSSSLPETLSGPPSHPRAALGPTIGVQRGSHDEPQLTRTNKAAVVPLFTEEDIEELLNCEDDGSKDETTTQADQPASQAPQHQTPDVPRPSPKPFFTSSGKTELMYLAIERIKTTAWESDQVRRKAQEDLQCLLRVEEEKVDRLLLEEMLQKEEEASAVSGEQPPRDVRDPLACQPCEQAMRKPASGRSQSQKNQGNSQGKHGRSQPRSPWDEMLELLAKTGSDQKAPAASQESDYGDALWDDDDLGLVDL